MSEMSFHPPALARLLLRLFVQDAGKEFVVGDLDEEYRRYVLPKIGLRLARRWYWWQAIRTVSCGLLKARRAERAFVTRSGREWQM
ncbi:MAG: hypothetical protein IID05_07085 [Gemmatimonadetes bacterium]|nr:hypothetical protein [Gemmatimonadota bacterium]